MKQAVTIPDRVGAAFVDTTPLIKTAYKSIRPIWVMYFPGR